MSDRARNLADRFAQAHGTFVAAVKQLPEGHWRLPVSDTDPRSVGVIARHVAWGYSIEQEYIGAILAGQPLPELSLGELDAMNTSLAQEWGDLRKAEVLAALQSAGAGAEAWIRGMSDEQLDRQGPYFAGLPPRTVAQWLEFPFLAHPGMHLPEIQAALHR
jgi:hypothetical protein